MQSRYRAMTEKPKQRSTEYYGLGQSGYTAGRVAGDLALEEQLEDRNETYPKGADVPPDGGDDDRFTGRGGRRWAPDESEAAREPSR
jgi:hypothetical protein